MKEFDQEEFVKFLDDSEGCFTKALALLGKWWEKPSGAMRPSRKNR